MHMFARHAWAIVFAYLQGRQKGTLTIGPHDYQLTLTGGKYSLSPHLPEHVNLEENLHSGIDGQAS